VAEGEDMPSKISRLRAIDAEIIRHFIERGKMLEKREQLVKSLRGTPELEGYEAELAEWLASIQSKGPG
jgi:hypothetical protein